MEVLQRTANRGSISTASYEIDNSLKFEADNSEYMHYTPSGQTDYERMAFSVWVKRTELSTAQLIMEFGNGTANTSNLRIGFDTSDRLFCYGNSIIWRQTNQVFRDTSAWYHLFFLFDTTTPGGVSNNRIRIWVNGSMIDHGDFGTLNNPGSGSAMGFNNSLKQSLGRQTEDATSYFCGYMAQVYGSGGTPPVVGDFGETDSDTGIWIPKDISDITPPDAAGFNLDFSTSGSLGNDISSRNNDFTLVNIAAADQATDTPTNNFATLLATNTHADFTIANGATSYKNTTNNWRSASASIAVQSGKWYAEFTPASSLTFIGVSNVQNFDFTTNYFGNWDTSIGYYGNAGLLFIDGATATFSGTGYGDGNKVGIAFDKDNGYVYWHKDGTWQNSGDPTSGASGTGGIALTQGNSAYQASDIFYMGVAGAHPNLTGESNFGGFSGFTISSPASDANGYGTFEYAPPTGYYALCTKNLAEYG